MTRRLAWTCSDPTSTGRAESSPRFLRLTTLAFLPLLRSPPPLPGASPAPHLADAVPASAGVRRPRTHGLLRVPHASVPRPGGGRDGHVLLVTLEQQRGDGFGGFIDAMAISANSSVGCCLATLSLLPPPSMSPLMSEEVVFVAFFPLWGPRFPSPAASQYHFLALRKFLSLTSLMPAARSCASFPSTLETAIAATSDCLLYARHRPCLSRVFSLLCRGPREAGPLFPLYS